MFDRLCLGVFLCLSSLIFSSISVADNDPLINGEVVDQAQYPAVVWIGYCTATVIGPRVILTAAHCNHRATVSLTTHGSTYTANLTTSAFYDPQFKYFGPDADLRTTSDLALGILDRAVDFTPVSVGGAAKVGQTGLLFGFGCDDRFDRHIDYQLRAGKNKIEKADKNGMLMKDPYGGASGCPGDSGGPTLVKSNNGELQLLGVHSQVGFANDGSRLPETWDTRTDLDTARDFLKDFAAANKVDICGITINCAH